MQYTLYHGKCENILPDLADNSVDAIITDPPYGTTQCAWDTVIPFNVMWEQLRRVIKLRGAIVLFGSQPFTSALVMSNPKMFRYQWVWDKGTPGNVYNANKMPLTYHEDICVFYQMQPTYNPQKWQGKPNHSRRAGVNPGNSLYGAPPRLPADLSGMKYPRSIIVFPKHSASHKHHRTEKPVALMEYLIRTYTNEGETVLDFTMGSGSTGVACMNTNRRFIGIEQDEGYYTIARARIEAAQTAQQLPLQEAGAS